MLQAEGYADGDLTLFHSFTVTSFLKADNPVDFLGKASEVRSQLHLLMCGLFISLYLGLFSHDAKERESTHNCFGFFIQITFDDKDLESHRATSAEIKECCRDIKVLGRKELRYVFIMKRQR